MLWVLTWWLWAEVLGLIAFPIAFVLFRNLYDRGYAFAKVLGLLLLAYGVWAGGSSGILPNTRPIALGVLGLIALVSAGLAWSQRAALAEFVRRRYGVLLVADAALLAFFLLGVVLRSFDPGVSHTEQPMDFAFLNALSRSRTFPPADPWLSGYTINYYYFGYLVWAVFAKLAATPTGIAYNLALALTMGLAAAAAFGLVFNLAQGSREKVQDRALAFGLVGATLLLVVSNLEGLLELAYAHGLGGTGFWSWLGIKGLATPYSSPNWYPSDNWWWWKATRVIDTVVNGQSKDYTITEFPFFSFLLGDLHPHVSALPLGLLSLGLSLELIRQPHGLAWTWARGNIGFLAASALVIGALGFANSWDLPTYGALWLACLGVWACGSGQRRWWLRAAALGGAVLAGAVVLYSPFYWRFSPQTRGVWPVLGATTWPVHYLVVWGAFVLPVAYIVLRGARRLRQVDWRVTRLALGVALVPLALWSAIALFLSMFGGEPGNGAVAWRWFKLAPLVAAIGGSLALAFGQASREGADRHEAFALLLLAFGLGVTYVPELFYVRDLFGNRMNTMFKLYYQGWTLLSLAAAYGLCRWGDLVGSRAEAGITVRSREPSGGNSRRVIGVSAWGGRLALALGAALIVAGLAYPAAAFASRQATSPGRFTVDALAPVEASRPGEYSAVRWLLERPGQPVVLEAVGGSYTGYARVSAMTGLPTVLGWSGHEHQWRGNTRPFEGREADVEQAYRSSDQAQVLALLRKYQVRYVYVGDLERSKYGAAVDGFQGMLPVAFSAPGVTIYEVPA
ncbi:MAG: hypothetical protein HYY01_06580 [Chloroflexi bacterium]|nr:hypothetical protein [Chloroflexota bacterium]